MNTEAAKIADSELEVMRLLWAQDEPAALGELIQVLGEKRGWKEPTTKTVVRNLRLKGSIELVSRGRYRAKISEAEYQEWSTHHFIGKIFEGSARKLVAALLSDGQLTEKDISELCEALNGGPRRE